MVLIANATLTYKERATTLSGEDSITGAPIYAETGTTFSLRVSIEQIVSQPKITPIPGSDRTGLYCEGRAKTNTDAPLLEMPSWYHADTFYDIQWDDGKIGQFYATPTILGRLGTEACFGYPIEGILVSNEAK